MIDLSIVIPLYNEEESLPELKAWIDRVLEGRSYEVIFVDDGAGTIRGRLYRNCRKRIRLGWWAFGWLVTTAKVLDFNSVSKRQRPRCHYHGC